jgi:hypothetical protein
VFLDQLITAEICQFGEEAKDIIFPLLTDQQRIQAAGDIRKMKKIHRRALIDGYGLLIAKLFVGPLVIIWFLSHPYPSLASSLMTTYLVFVAGCIILAPWAIARRRRARKGSLKEKMLHLWRQMHDVWRLLEGPTVNPRRVREAMMETTKQSAVWRNSAWALIDRVIASDPAVWLVGIKRA